MVALDKSAKASDVFAQAARGQTFLAGDFADARRMHSGFLTRLRPKVFSDLNLYRVAQAKERHILSRLVLAVSSASHEPLCANAPPQLQPACQQAFAAMTAPSPDRYQLAFKDALSVIGVAELRRIGVDVQGVGIVRPHYGVFAPTRSVYCDLLAAYLSQRFGIVNSAIDVGTGTGVMALLMAKSGKVAHITATDNSAAAVACATENITAHAAADVTVLKTDLFPANEAKYDLIVFNPPWIPGKSFDNAAIDGAVFDYRGLTLSRFLGEARLRLAGNGRIALVMSNLAELLNLREPIAEYASTYGWVVEEQTDAPVRKPPVAKRHNALAQKEKEIVSLYILKQR